MSRREKRVDSRDESVAGVPMTVGAGGVPPSIATAVLPPWPEWSDADVNSEKWEAGIGHATAKGKEKAKTATSTAGTPATSIGFEDPVGHGEMPASLSSLPLPCSSPLNRAPALRFEDPVGHGEMPASLDVVAWKRPAEVSDGFEVVQEHTDQTDLDLVTNNVHLLHSPVMRDIIAGIMNLYHYAEIEPFHAECESGNFSPTGGHIWRPWHHVYSCCKVGKGQTHRPVVNHSGKYIVRIFFMGAWRKITVDDYIPLDKFRRILLPTTLHSELWPIMLAKGLLKVARLTWQRGREVVDFSVATCLTGWMMQQVDCCHIPYTFLWQVCQKVLMADDEDITLRYGYGTVDVVSERKTSLQKHYTSLTQEHHKLNEDEGFVDIGTNPEHEILGKVIVFGVMRDVMDMPVELADVGPCVAHSVLLSEARVFFLGEYGDGTPFPLWKVFRWKAWAIKKGIIKDIKDINMKSVRLFSPLKKCTIPDHELLDTPSELVSVFEIESTAAQAGQGDGLKPQSATNKGKKGNEKGDAKSSVSKESKASKKSNSSKIDKKSEKSKGSAKSKNKGDSKDKIKEMESIIKPNTDSWMDIHILTEYLEALHIFYRPSSFPHQQKISDVSQITQMNYPSEKPPSSKKGAAKDSSSHSVPSRTPLTAAKTTTHKNNVECFYLYADSHTCKKFFFTLSIVPACALEDMMTIIKVPNVSPKISNDQVDVSVNGNIIPPSYITAEFYRWKSIEDGELVFSMKTCGTNSVLVQLGEGIQVLKVWCKVPQHHVLQILSQTPFFIGSKERVQESLTNASESMNFYAMHMFNKFAELATSEIGSPEHSDALSAFHSSYMPPCEINVGQQPTHHQSSKENKHMKLNTAIRAAFEHAAVDILYEKLKDRFETFYTALLELQNWFQNPRFGLEPLSEISPEFLETFDALQVAAALKAEQEAAEAAAALLELQLHPPKIETANKKKGDAKKGKSEGKSDTKKSKSEGKSDLKNKKNESKENKGKKTDSKVKSETGSKGSKNDGKKGAHDKGKGHKGGGQSHHILFESPQDSTNILQLMLAWEPSVLKYYPFRNDFNMQLAYTDFKGVTKVNVNQDWIPLFRYVVNIDHTLPAFNEIDLHTSLTSAVLRVVDNDSLDEIPRVTSNENKSTFYRNEYGYTVFAYGFNDTPSKPKEHTWKLRILADHKMNLLHRCGGNNNGVCTSVIPPGNLLIKEVKGYYFPNRLNNILRCLLTIPTEQIVGIRVTMSRPDVEYLFTICYDESFSLVVGNKCRGNVIIPCRQLFPHRDEEGNPVKTVFLLEAQLVNDSWHLSEDELKQVTTLKEHAKTSMLIFSHEDILGARSKRTSSRKVAQSSHGSIPKITSKNFSQLELEPGSPQWTVQVVVDEESGADVVLEMNRRKAEEVRRLKATWEKEDPGRHKRAMRIRDEYLSNRRKGDGEESQDEIFARMTEGLFCPSKQWVNLGSPLPRDSYIQGDFNSEWKTMTYEHGKELSDAHTKQWEEFEEGHNRFMDELHNINDQQMRTHNYTFMHYNKERDSAREMMEEAYKLRDEFVRKELAKLDVGDAKGKKDKKSKGDKKGKEDKKSKGDASSKKSKKK